MKKIWIILGGILALLLALIIAIPFFINVDQYRPLIEKESEKFIHGKLSLGHLKLSLWGQIRIEVDGVKLTDAQGKEMLSVQDAYFHLPFSSLFAGAPSLSFQMNKPNLFVEKGKDGKLNFQKLVKVSSTSPTTPPEEKKEVDTPAGADSSKNMELPTIVARSRLSIELKNALVSYVDPAQELSNKIENFNILFQDISLTTPMKIRIWADLNTTLGKKLSVQGPFEIQSQLEVIIKNQAFELFTAQTSMNFDGLSIQLPGIFHKKKGDLANINSKMKVTPTDFFLEETTLRFMNAVIQAKGEVKGYDKIEKKETALRFQLKTDPVDLSPWAALSESAKDTELTGLLKFNAEIFGPMHELQANALFEVQKLTAKTPAFKSKPEMNLLVSIQSDQMDRFHFDLKAPKNDLKILGTIKNIFKAPLAQFNVSSTGMDLNELMVLPDPKKKVESKTAEVSTTQNSGGVSQPSGEQTTASNSADYDALLDPMRKSEFLKKTSGKLGIQIQFIKIYDIVLDKILSDMTFKDLVFALQKFQFQIFKGTIEAKAQMDFKPKAPTYQIFTQVQGLDTKAAMESQLELFKNTIQGRLNFKAQGNGQSFNPAPAKKNLNMTGNFIFSQAKFTTLDIGKMVTEAVNGSLAQVGEKVPQLKGKQLKGLSGREARYEQIASNFSIKDGVFRAPDFIAKSEKGSSLDLKGNTTLNIISQAIDAEWSVVDVHNVTGAADISVNIAGQEVNKILAEKNQPVRFPVKIGCQATAPCTDTKAVPAHFISVATQNIAGAGKAMATAKAKQEVKKVIEKNPEVQKALDKAPEPAKKLLKGLGF